MSRPSDDWYAGNTDIGLVRSGNEDALLLAPPLFAVADGLGGHQAGEIASEIAIDVLLKGTPRTADARALGRAVRAANSAVIDAAAAGRGRSGMGTTLTAAMVEGNRVALAHVGDSRAYLLHYGVLEQLTDDHSMVADMVRRGTLSAEESREHPQRSVITRALGSDPDMIVDAFEVDAAPGDRLLLTTDGLTSLVRDETIARVLASAATPAEATEALIDAALDAGGHDNITVVVADIGSASRVRPEISPGPPPRWWLRSLWLLVALAVIVGAAAASNAFARAQAFVIDEGGVVAVYQGVPGTFAGISLNWHSRTTTVPVDALDPITAARLEDGIRVDGLAEAEEIVSVYAEQAASIEATAAGTP
jgi:protein phosphatase